MLRPNCFEPARGKATALPRPTPSSTGSMHPSCLPWVATDRVGAGAWWSMMSAALVGLLIAGATFLAPAASAYPTRPGSPGAGGAANPERGAPLPGSQGREGPADPSDARPSSEASPSAGRNKTHLNDTVVKVEARAVAGAESNESLGQRRSGTGVLLDKSTILTIGYLLVEVDEIDVVTPSGKRIPASVAGYDPDSGFGVVRTAVPLDGRPLELGDSDSIGERQQVLTLGHGEPEATELMVISRKPFAGSWEYLIDKGIFTFPPVNNWSGAALVDNGGKLVGIGSLIVNDAATSQPGVPGNLYVPVNLLKPILADLLSTGRRGGPALPWLGVVTEVVQGHLLIARVTRGGPAERAGLAAGDIIVSVDGQYVANQSEFYQGVRKRGAAGVTIPLRVLKRGDLLDVSITSSDRMENLRKPQGI